MTRLSYVIQHWDQIVSYLYLMAAGKSNEWLRISAPYLLAALGSSAVALIVVREQVGDIKAKVDKGILPVAEERYERLTLELIQIRHQHELTLDRLNAVETSGPIYCLRCHMQQGRGFNHPSLGTFKRSKKDEREH